MQNDSHLDVVVADPGHAATVLALVREHAAHERWLDGVTRSELCWRVMLADADVTVLIAVGDGAPLGFVSAVRRPHLRSGGHIIVIDDLYVRPSAGTERVDEALMQELQFLAHLGAQGRVKIGEWFVEEK